MSQLPVIYLARHGETEWSKSGQHTGRTDLPLTPFGEATARGLAERLRGITFSKVFASPLLRAWRTCELAGFGGAAVKDDDLLEWDYGRHEGRKSVEIKAEFPTWELFRDGGPGGESPADVAGRADRMAAKLRACTGNVIVFSSGHLLRVLAARWCRQDVTFARHLLLGTGSVCILGFDHNNIDEPAIRLWNQTA